MENFKFTNSWFNDAAKYQWEKLIFHIIFYDYFLQID